MAGGLEGRIAREELRGQKLLNLQRTLGLISPEAGIQDSLNRESLRGLQLRNNQQQMQAPFDLQAAMQQSQEDPQADMLRSVLSALTNNPSAGGSDVINEFLQNQGFKARLAPFVGQSSSFNFGGMESLQDNSMATLQALGMTPEQLAAMSQQQ